MSKTNIPCPVCGKYIFNKEADYDICKYCGWENEDYYGGGGANDLSLEEYQQRYHAYVELNPDYIWKKHGCPELSTKDLCQLAHKYSFQNEADIQTSNTCGCFFCGKIFDKTLVAEWISDNGGRTALCPHCGIDSVLPDSKVEFSKEFLEQMYKVWFE